jgi:hypothetical protein
MAEEQLQPEGSSQAPEPIFEMDIKCPECHYNLRGLMEPRCPECGVSFDPPAVLREHLRRQRPGMRWVVRQVFRHPVGFWSLPEVAKGIDPTITHMLTLTLLTAILNVPLGPQKFGKPVTRIEPWLMPVLFFAVALAATAANLLLQQALCWFGLLVRKASDRRRVSARIVWFSGTWMLPISYTIPSDAIFFILLWKSVLPDAPVPPPFAQWAVILGAISLAAVVACCVLWGVALYSAGLSVRPRRRGFALWCLLSNPFGFVVYKLLIVLLRQ